MGLKNFFGFGSSENDTMGPAGSETQEKARRNRIEETGHASEGYAADRDELISMPTDKRPRRR
jgi:hypothetical protein